MFDLDKSEIYRKAKLVAVLSNTLIQDKVVSGEEAHILRRQSLELVTESAGINGWFHRSERLRQFVQFRSSVHKLVALLDVLKEEQHINLAQFTSIVEVLDDLSRMLYGMIKKATETEEVN